MSFDPTFTVSAFTDKVTYQAYVDGFNEAIQRYNVPELVQLLLLNEKLKKTHRKSNGDIMNNKTWKQMSLEERKEISFQAMSGRDVELYVRDTAEWLLWDGITPLADCHQPMRLRKESKLSSVTLYFGELVEGALLRRTKTDTHLLMLELINGIVPEGTYVNQDGNKIEVKKLK
jgi:hypothetical protein